MSDGNASGFSAARSVRRAPAAFTLIELLVVIGIIVLLAGMSFPAMKGVKAAQARTRARAELTQIETAIENYKTKLGFYPPDNAASDWTANQLYYELLGTRLTTNGVYQTLDGSASTTTSIMNCAKGGAGDDVPNAVKFLTGLKNGQFLVVGSTAVLGVSMQGAHPGANNAEIVPYGYNSSSPAHNPKSFDLWVDIIAGGKTNRISNWSSRPIIVSTTAYPQ